MSDVINRLTKLLNENWHIRSKPSRFVLSIPDYAELTDELRKLQLTGVNGVTFAANMEGDLMFQGLPVHYSNIENSGILFELNPVQQSNPKTPSE